MTLSEAKEYTGWLVFRMWIIVMVAIGITLLPLGRDDTDPDWPKRSGLNLYTDAKTGCQYLSARGNGIAPRLDKSGRHLGCHKADLPPRDTPVIK